MKLADVPIKERGESNFRGRKVAASLQRRDVHLPGRGRLRFPWPKGCGFVTRQAWFGFHQSADSRRNPEPSIWPGDSEKRHEAQVKRAMAAGGTVVVVLGASHDLTGALQRLGGSKTEYIVVTPKRVRELNNR